MVGSVDQLKSLVNQKKGIARPNLFRVKLPSLPGGRMEELNIICKDVTLPGRQVVTNERRIGMRTEKIPYGYIDEDVSMTFHVLNDYGVKEYFDAWVSLAVDVRTNTVGYQRGPGRYSFDVEIEQLRKPTKMPSYLKPNISNNSNGLNKFLPNLSDFQIVQDFYDLAQDLNDITIYRCRLINAFPTTMTAIQLNNELDGVVSLNIGMSYTRWESPFLLSPSNLVDNLAEKTRYSIIGFIDNLIN